MNLAYMLTIDLQKIQNLPSPTFLVSPDFDYPKYLLLMKLILFFFILFSCSTFAQEMRYTDGKVVRDDKVFKKPKELKVIIASQTSPEVKTQFRRYRNNYALSWVGAFFAGVSTGAAVGGLVSGGGLDPMLGVCTGGFAGLSFLFDKKSKMHLKKMVEIHNEVNVYNLPLLAPMDTGQRKK